MITSLQLLCDNMPKHAEDSKKLYQLVKDVKNSSDPNVNPLEVQMYGTQPKPPVMVNIETK